MIKFIVWSIFLCALLLPSCGGSGGSSGSGEDAPDAPIGPPPLAVEIQDLSNLLPGVFNLRYVVLGDGESAASAQIEYTTNGSQFFPATRVAGEDPSAIATSPNGIFHIFIWNSIEDLGMSANFANVRIRIRAQDADEVAEPVLSDPFPIQNALLQQNLVQSVFPNIADIQNAASPHFAATSIDSSSANGGILKESFTYTSSHFDTSGPPTNLDLCGGCPATLPQWKKDTWGPIAADLYTREGESPTEFLILQLKSDDMSVWSGAFASLFPEFAAAGDPISGAGSPLQFDQGMLDEFVNEVVLSLGVGVCVLSGLPQAHADWIAEGKDLDAAWLASADEALFRVNPRWSLTTGHAEALLRAGTAIEKVRSLTPGSSRLLIGDSWMGGVAALLAAAVDDRVQGAASFSAEFGRWERLAYAAQNHFEPWVENFYERAKKQVPLLHVAGDLYSFVSKIVQPSGEAFTRAFQPSHLIGLLQGLGKPTLVQGGSSDARFPLQLRELWLDEELAAYYPGLKLHQDFSANFGHGMGSPQSLRNWRSFAASVFRGRPLPKIAMSSTVSYASGFPVVSITAHVSNPGPATAGILSCRLRFAGDDDGYLRYFELPDANLLTEEFDPGLGSCNNYTTGASEFCLDEAEGYRNLNWSSALMTTTGNPATDQTLVYTATLDGATVPGDFIAFFVEVEDEVLAGALPNAGDTRSYSSSVTRLVQK